MSVVKTKKYGYIDSLRGYAVLMVLCTHVYAFICHSDKSIFLSNFWVQCRMGVMLFFMVSSLTLYLSLQQKIDKEKKPIRNFFLRRFFRIAPLFYLLGFLNLIFYKFSWVNIISTFSFTNGFIPGVMMKQIVGGGWTLAVEMAFYVLLPIIFMYVKNISRALLFFVFTFILSIVLKYIMLHHFIAYYQPVTLIEYTYYWLPAQLPIFSLGIIIYFVLFRMDFLADTEPLFKKHLGYFLIFCALYFMVTMSFSNKLFITENIAFSFALMLFIGGMTINAGSIFNNKPIQFVGKISYSFYLIHGIMIGKMLPYTDKLAIKGNLLFVTGAVSLLVITSCISFISYKLIELPFQKLGAGIIEKLERKNDVKTHPAAE